MLAETIVAGPVTSPNLHRSSDRPERARSLASRIGAPCLLFLAALVTYAPALRNGFVGDDQALILRDPLIRSWRLIWEGFQHFLFTDVAASDFYRPLQRLTYTLDYAAYFQSPAGYHFTSILWHAAAAIALFFFAGEFLSLGKMAPARRTVVAFAAALVWLVHPVQSAAVVYVSGRADPLAATFGFLALFLALRMLAASGNRKWFLGLGAGFCFLASALSKEMGLIFLLAWLLLVLARRQRGAWPGAVGIVVCVLVAYLGLRLPAEHLAPPPVPAAPLLVRPIVTARAAAEYAELLIFPLRLHEAREVETQPTGYGAESLTVAAWRELQTLLGILLLAGAIYLIWRARRQSAVFRLLLLAAVFYLPVSGGFRLNATVAEHWLYLPSAFLFLAAATALESLGETGRNPTWRKAAGVVLTIWVILLPVRTFARTFDWKDQRTFLTRTIADGGDSARMLIDLGSLELNEGHFAAARAALEKALVKEPDNPLAQLQLAAVEIKQLNFGPARARLKKIVDPPELMARAQESLVVLENRENGKVDLLRLRLAARLGALNWLIEQRYIRAFESLKVPERALAELRSCVEVAPYRAESWWMMSELLQKLGRPTEAAAALSQAEAADVYLHARVGH